MPRKKAKDAAPGPKIEAVATATAEAKAKAKAKATYSRKKTIMENIPEDVTRAKAGAWLDLISPLVEAAGRKGDAIAAEASA